MSVDNDSGKAPASGILHSLRNIGPALIALARTRVELFAIELAEERGRVATLALHGALALLFAGLALLMVNVLLLVICWETHRYHAIVGLLILYAAGALYLVMRIKEALAARSPLFEATLAELKADLEALNRARQG